MIYSAAYGGQRRSRRWKYKYVNECNKLWAKNQPIAQKRIAPRLQELNIVCSTKLPIQRVSNVHCLRNDAETDQKDSGCADDDNPGPIRRGCSCCIAKTFIIWSVSLQNLHTSKRINETVGYWYFNYCTFNIIVVTKYDVLASRHSEITNPKAVAGWWSYLCDPSLSTVRSALSVKNKGTVVQNTV